MGKADCNVVRTQQGRRHQHHVGIVLDIRSHSDAQELVGDIACDLGRAADTVEVPLAGLGEKVRGPVESVDIQDRQRFLERMDRGPEHLLDDFPRTVFDRQFLMHLGRREPVVARDRGAEIAIAAEAELLGDLDDHRLRDAGFGGYVLQCRVLREIAQPEYRFHHTCLQRRELRHHHPDARAHRLGIICRIHPLPLVTRSIIIATRIIRPVASS
jgi:hypothetical protein